MDNLNKIYTQYIAEEVASSEVQKAKEAFILEHFSTPTSKPVGFAFKWQPALAMSVLLICALGVVFSNNKSQSLAPATPQMMTAAQQQASRIIAVDHDVKRSVAAQTHLMGEVRVKELSSQVGPTMIYHKTFSDVDVTVVWVFPQGA